MSTAKSATRKTVTAKRAPNRTRQDRDESIRLELIGARAAVATTILCLHGGVYDEVRTNLIRAASLPLERALAYLERQPARAVQP